MGTRRHAMRCVAGCEAGTNGKTATETFRQAHDVRFDVCRLMGEQIASATHPALDFVEDQQQAQFVAQIAELTQEGMAHWPDTTLALNGLDHDGCSLWSDASPDGPDVLKRALVESIDSRPEAIEIFPVAACGHRSKRATVKGSAERDDPPPLMCPASAPMRQNWAD